jgi:hypothetical protein
MKVEHTSALKAMSDEQLEAAIEAVEAMLEQRAGEAAKVIEGQAEPVALPPPSRKVRRKVRRTPGVEPSDRYAHSAARPCPLALTARDPDGPIREVLQDSPNETLWNVLARTYLKIAEGCRSAISVE